jgi:hypothetical protein
MLAVSLALGVFVLLAVPIHSAFIAETGVLSDQRYVFAACRYPFPLAPDAVCPEVFAGESPFMVLYALVVVPLLLIRGGPKTTLAIALLSLAFALIQVGAAFYTALPSEFFPRTLNPELLPSAFERDPATCGLVLCGLDHSLFHFAQVPLLLALSVLGYRANREAQPSTAEVGPAVA